MVSSSEKRACATAALARTLERGRISRARTATGPELDPVLVAPTHSGPSARSAPEDAVHPVTGVMRMQRGAKWVAGWENHRVPQADSELLVIDGHEVTISNPQKVLFPDAGYTKLDVVRYYLA